MSAMSVSKSYAVLLGLEGYTRTKKKLKGVGRFLARGKEDEADGGGKQKSKGNGLAAKEKADGDGKSASKETILPRR